MTSIVDDFDAIRAGMPSADQIAGDRRILGLFREWQAALGHAALRRGCDPPSDAAVRAAGERIEAIEDQIAATAATDAAGLAIKLFLSVYYEGEEAISDALGAELRADGRFTRSALADAARLVPELALLVAAAIAGDRQEDN
jgi:hypothetical protein